MSIWDEVLKWASFAANFATTITAVVTLFTLWSLRRQTQCDTEQTRLLGQQVEFAVSTNREALYQNVMKEMQDISKLFMEWPELRCYFYEGCAPPHEGELKVRVQIMSEMLVDFMGFTLNTYDHLSVDEKNGWTSYFADVARSSPALRSYWRDRREWYEQPVQELLDPIVSEIPDDPRSGGLAAAS